MNKALSDPEAWFKCRYCFKCYQGATNFIQHKQDTHEEYWIDRKKREASETESIRQPSASSSEYDGNSDNESTSESSSSGSTESSLPEAEVDSKALKIATQLRHLTDDNVEFSDDASSESSFDPDSSTSEESESSDDESESSEDESYTPKVESRRRRSGSGRLTRNRVKELSQSPTKQAESLQCKYCNKQFRCKGPLRIHLRIHTAERPYKCSFCSRRFTQLSVQKKHELSSHFEDAVSQNLKVMSKLRQVSEEPSGQRRGRKRRYKESLVSPRNSFSAQASSRGSSKEHLSSSPAKNLRSSKSTGNLRVSPRKKLRYSRSRDSSLSSPTKDPSSYKSEESLKSSPSRNTRSSSSKSKESFKSSFSRNPRNSRSRESLRSPSQNYRSSRSKESIK